MRAYMGSIRRRRRSRVNLGLRDIWGLPTLRDVLREHIQHLPVINSNQSEKEDLHMIRRDLHLVLLQLLEHLDDLVLLFDEQLAARQRPCDLFCGGHLPVELVHLIFVSAPTKTRAFSQGCTL